MLNKVSAVAVMAWMMLGGCATVINAQRPSERRKVVVISLDAFGA